MKISLSIAIRLLQLAAFFAEAIGSQNREDVSMLSFVEDLFHFLAAPGAKPGSSEISGRSDEHSSHSSVEEQNDRKLGGRPLSGVAANMKESFDKFSQASFDKEKFSIQDFDMSPADPPAKDEDEHKDDVLLIELEEDGGPNPIVTAGGGKNADLGEYPYFASIVSQGGIRCGASWIAPQWLLSAAHCVFNPADTFVGTVATVGAYFDPLDGLVSDGSAKVLIDYQVTHPNYFENTDTGFLYYDYMLLHLASEPQLGISSNVRLKLSDDRRDVLPGTVITTIGLGLTASGGDNPDILQETSYVAISDGLCQVLLGTGFVDKLHLCDGRDFVGNACVGDSGGPSVRKVGDTHYQVGIVSFGPADCLDGPSVSARIDPIGYDWIQTQICEIWEDEAPHLCEDGSCSSDCDCKSGYECLCLARRDRNLDGLKDQFPFVFQDKDENDGNYDEVEDWDDDETTQDIEEDVNIEETEDLEEGKLADDYVHMFSSSYLRHARDSGSSQPGKKHQRTLKSDKSSSSSSSSRDCREKDRCQWGGPRLCVRR